MPKKPDVKALLRARSNKGGVDIVDADTTVNTKKYLTLLPQDIEPDPSQPRKTFDPEKLDELKSSIKARGQQQPITVRKGSRAGKYIIISGERRWRAISELEGFSIDCIYDEGGSVEELDLLLRQLDENERRADVNAFETAQQHQRVFDLCDGDLAEAAAQVQMSKSRLSTSLKLVGSSELIREFASKNNIKDVDALNALVRIAEADEGKANEFIKQYENGEVNSLRKEATGLAKSSAPAAKKKSKTKPSSKTAAKQLASASITENEEGYVLEIVVGEKPQIFSMPKEVYEKLIGGLNA